MAKISGMLKTNTSCYLLIWVPVHCRTRAFWFTGTMSCWWLLPLALSMDGRTFFTIHWLNCASGSLVRCVVCYQSMKSKRELYFVSNKSSTAPSESMNQSEGLGRLPQTIQSVSSLLLFNTSENPWVMPL